MIVVKFSLILNESGSYYDATSGSFVDSYGNSITTDTTPDYLWNRAWLNRMDIDASINIDNEFPTSAGCTNINQQILTSGQLCLNGKVQY